MTDMPQPAHAKAVTHRDHLWVVFVIALAAAIEVCTTWVEVGNVSGFPVIRLPFRLNVNTDFSLMVGMEAYGGFALYYWLAAAPGRRSRAFAMWSAIGALVLSLIGQVSYHILAADHVVRPPATVIGFVSALPVVVLGFAAILVHLVHLDREEAADAERRAAEADRLAAIERAEADERTVLRAELEAAHAARVAAESAVEPLRADLAQAVAKAETLAQKLAAMSARKSNPRARNRSKGSAQADDATTELRALMELKADPELRKPRMGGELARRLGVSAATGRRLHGRLAAQAAPADPLAERSLEQLDERSDERS